MLAYETLHSCPEAELSLGLLAYREKFPRGRSQSRPGPTEVVLLQLMEGSPLLPKPVDWSRS